MLEVQLACFVHLFIGLGFVDGLLSSTVAAS